MCSLNADEHVKYYTNSKQTFLITNETPLHSMFSSDTFLLLCLQKSTTFMAIFINRHSETIFNFTFYFKGTLSIACFFFFFVPKNRWLDTLAHRIIVRDFQRISIFVYEIINFSKMTFRWSSISLPVRISYWLFRSNSNIFKFLFNGEVFSSRHKHIRNYKVNFCWNLASDHII